MTYNVAATISLSLKAEVPPGAYAENKISSFLKSVGLRMTFTLLAKVSSVVPKSLFSFFEITLMAFGFSAINGSLLLLST